MNKQVLIGTAAIALIIGAFFTYASLRLANVPDPASVDTQPEEITDNANVSSDQDGSYVLEDDVEEGDDDLRELEKDDRSSEDDLVSKDDPTSEDRSTSNDVGVEQKEVQTDKGQTTVNTTPPAPPATTGIALSEVATHNSESSCWMVIRGKVYDVTSYIDKHPAGKSTILKGCGKDATSMFEGVKGHLKQKTLDLLPGYFKGALAS